MIFNQAMGASLASPIFSSWAYQACERALAMGEPARGAISELAKGLASLGPVVDSSMFKRALGRLRFVAAGIGRLDWVRELDLWGACGDERDSEGACALMRAAEQDFLELCEHLLQSDPAGFARVDKSGSTALHRALRCGCVATARLLIAKGADPLRRDGLGRDALSWASRTMSQELVEELAQSCDPWSCDDSGKLPLQAAAEARRAMACRHLGAIAMRRVASLPWDLAQEAQAALDMAAWTLGASKEPCEDASLACSMAAMASAAREGSQLEELLGDSAGSDRGSGSKSL